MVRKCVVTKRKVVARLNKGKKYTQSGKRKSITADRRLKATTPGWRVSKRCKVYYENRKNRTDKKGKRI